MFVEGPFRYVTVQNSTSQELRFEVVGEDGRVHALGSVKAGARGVLLSTTQLGEFSVITRDGCTVGEVVAFDTLGDEVARHSRPLCADDHWEIGPGASPS